MLFLAVPASAILAMFIVPPPPPSIIIKDAMVIINKHQQPIIICICVPPNVPPIDNYVYTLRVIACKKGKVLTIFWPTLVGG